MKHTVLFAVLGVVAFGAAAQEVGNVISSRPVIQQVAVPRQTCVPGMVQAQPQTSGMGGLAGAITGAAVGSQIGGGNGAIAAGLIGAVGGAILGNNIEGSNMRAQQAAVPTCTTETTYENRAVGYDVVYEYAGQQYTARLPYDPGPTIRLSVTPVSQGSAAPIQGMAEGPVTAPPVQGIATVPAPVAPAAPAAPMPAPIATAPVYVPAPVVVQPYPVYPAYPAYPYAYPAYRPYYYPPVSLSLGFVFRGGHGGYRRWR